MFRNMKYIYAIYQEGSFSAAAKKLYITQPCLSAMVKKTEQQLGVPIFDRNSKPLELTEYGKQYIGYLEKMQDLERELEQYISDVQGLKTGTVSIGTNNVFASFVLPELICRFNEYYPAVQVQMVEGNIAYLEQGLRQGTLDLVLENCPMDTALFRQISLGTEHLLLAVPGAMRDRYVCGRAGFTYEEILKGRHLQKDTPEVSILDFQGAPLIALRPGNDTRIRMDAICKQSDVTPWIRMEVDQLATAYNIACSGLGVTLVSDTLIRKAAPYPDVRYYKLASEISRRPVYLYCKKARYITCAMQKFMDMAWESTKRETV